MEQVTGYYGNWLENFIAYNLMDIMKVLVCLTFALIALSIISMIVEIKSYDKDTEENKDETLD